MALGNFAEAEAFLRQLAGEVTAAPEGHVAVVQLLRQAQGEAAALAELDRLIAANAGNENADLYGALRAAILFERGNRSDAIAAMEAIAQDAEPSDQSRRIKVMLARMLAATGNQVGARARVEEVLAEDGTNSEALKMRAAWAIEDDKADQAILDLRAALDQNPRDAQTLTLLSQANERLGNLELAGERLSQAVEVSGAAPDETLRYVRFLRREGRNSSVPSLLIDALRANPAHVGLLTQLADFYLNQGQWERAQDVVARLSALDNPEAQRAAEPLQAAILLAQNRTDEGIAFLQSLAGSAGEGSARGAAAVASVVQTQLRAGQPEAAREYVDEQLAQTPNDPGLRLISGSLYAVTGDAARAETIYRDLVAERPGAEAPVRLLYGLLEGNGRSAEAEAVLDAGIEAQPGSIALRLIKASRLEQQGDVEGAIAVYEALYSENSNNVLVANNLASLITTFRDTPEDLDRAFAIARRLSNSNVPAFQDTYGWIEYRRGNHEAALRYLEPAAEGLPDDPLVQFHLGMTYAALDRNEEAKAALRRALENAGENSTLPQMDTARETLESLP
jgi:tetratricopeptide (TPR) repeat protein